MILSFLGLKICHISELLPIRTLSNVGNALRGTQSVVHILFKYIFIRADCGFVYLELLLPAYALLFWVS